MNTWIITAFNSNNFPRTITVEVTATDIMTAITVSGLHYSDIVSVKIKGL